ncbi:Cupin 2, conserved barrel [Paraglaciecola sp. T6c]|uniref:cupin domain-containing protein n=1 Tax=Pseudoalteromonas atlantica (strain T6c / ATCC BAA-1087) TaxID=3042615 RepID=UPI0000DA6DFA|nr:cupin domain-containing protein [Paraglaciecola sp. T6c]ABG40840.1 Cupin 2, conserved barrel [Paraglaciecola sp. T6c]
MNVTKLEDAMPYQAPGHFDVCGLRLQGWDASDTENFWVGLSHFLPGGGAQGDVSPLEKVYVVLEGSVSITHDNKEVILGPLDSCRIPPNAKRTLINKTNNTVSMLVIMPYPENK